MRSGPHDEPIDRIEAARIVIVIGCLDWLLRCPDSPRRTLRPATCTSDSDEVRYVRS